MNAERARSHPSPVFKWLTRCLQGVIAVGLALAAYERQWLNVAIISAILLITLLPTLFVRQFDVRIPPEIELAAIALIFVAPFLGETQDFYGRIWWWDLALHTTSGGLLGVLGVLLVYVLNENPRIDLKLRPAFVAIFAFCFAMTIGVLWEIFEFGMDRLFGMSMQKPMFGDASGLTDTMWDLIVNTLGAAVVSAGGYLYVKQGSRSFVENWVARFIARNPKLFPRDRDRIGSHQDALPVEIR